MAFKNGCYIGLATHDLNLTEKLYDLIEKHNVSKENFEFQILYGVPMKGWIKRHLKNNFNIKEFSLNVGLQIRNLFDEKYYDNIRTNAFGNRFYEPASLRQFIFSINTTFK